MFFQNICLCIFSVFHIAVGRHFLGLFLSTNSGLDWTQYIQILIKCKTEVVF